MHDRFPARITGSHLRLVQQRWAALHARVLQCQLNAAAASLDAPHKDKLVVHVELRPAQPCVGRPVTRLQLSTAAIAGAQQLRSQPCQQALAARVGAERKAIAVPSQQRRVCSQPAGVTRILTLIQTLKLP